MTFGGNLITERNAGRPLCFVRKGLVQLSWPFPVSGTLPCFFVDETMANHLRFIVTIVVYSVANVYTNENLNVDETTVPVAGRGRESPEQIGDIPKFLLQMFLSYAKDDQRTKRYSKLPIPTVHGFLGQGNVAFFSSTIYFKRFEYAKNVLRL